MTQDSQGICATFLKGVVQIYSDYPGISEKKKQNLRFSLFHAVLFVARNVTWVQKSAPISQEERGCIFHIFH